MLNSLRHREDGPAVEYLNAVEYALVTIIWYDGYKEWYTNGIKYNPENQFKLNWKKEGF